MSVLVGMIQLASLGLVTVPVLFRGPGTVENIKRASDNLDTERQEGIVIRPAGSFVLANFSKEVGKWVRAKHVQTDEHWMSKPVEYNGTRR